jgi:shikimate kinase
VGLIFLCGLPGCGKTTIGNIAAQLTGSQFFDLDEYVEAIVGKPIVKIFEEEGEAAFREYEQEALIRACEFDDAVIALGAGALESQESLLLSLASGTLIYLRLEPMAIAQRDLDWMTRPLMAGLSTQQKVADRLTALLIRRESNYMHAEIVINIIPQESPEQTAERILSELKLR